MKQPQIIENDKFKNRDSISSQQRKQQKLKRSSTNINDGLIMSGAKPKLPDDRRFSSTFILKDGSKFQIIEQKYRKTSLKEVQNSSQEVSDKESEDNEENQKATDGVQAQEGEKTEQNFKLSIRLPRNSCDSDTKSIIMQIPNFADNLTPTPTPFSGGRRPSASSLFVATNTNASTANNEQLKNQYQNAQFSNYLYQIKEEQSSPTSINKIGKHIALQRQSLNSIKDEFLMSPKTTTSAATSIMHKDNQLFAFSKGLDQLRKQQSIPLNFPQSVNSPRNQTLDLSSNFNNFKQQNIDQQTQQQILNQQLHNQNSQVFNQSLIKQRKNSKRTSFASSINNSFIFIDAQGNLIEYNAENINNNNINDDQNIKVSDASHSNSNNIQQVNSNNNLANSPMNAFSRSASNTDNQQLFNCHYNNLGELGSPSNCNSNQEMISERNINAGNEKKSNHILSINSNNGPALQSQQIEFKQLCKRSIIHRKTANFVNNLAIQEVDKNNSDQKRVLYHQKSAQLDNKGNVQAEGDQQRANAFIAEAITHQIKEDFIKIPEQKNQILNKQPSISLCLQQDEIIDLNSHRRQSNLDKDLSELLNTDLKIQTQLGCTTTATTQTQSQQKQQDAQINEANINSPLQIQKQLEQKKDENDTQNKNIIANTDACKVQQQLINSNSVEQQLPPQQPQINDKQQPTQQQMPQVILLKTTNQQDQQQIVQQQQILSQSLDNTKQQTILENFSIDKYFKPPKKILINCEKIRSISSTNSISNKATMNNKWSSLSNYKKFSTFYTNKQNCHPSKQCSRNINMSLYQIDQVILDDILNQNKVQEYCDTYNKNQLHKNQNFPLKSDRNLTPLENSTSINERQICHYSSNTNLREQQSYKINSFKTSRFQRNQNFHNQKSSSINQSIENVGTKLKISDTSRNQNKVLSNNNQAITKSSIVKSSSNQKEQPRIIKKIHYHLPKQKQFNKYQLLFTSLQTQKELNNDHIFKFQGQTISLKDIRQSLHKWFKI